MLEAVAVEDRWYESVGDDSQNHSVCVCVFFFFQAEDGIRDRDG